MNKNDITLLINSCDNYQDILDPFFELLHRYWRDLDFEIVLSTESLEYKNKYFKIRNVHPKNIKCSWTRRMYEALKEIKTNYVLFLLDDFFLYDHVNTKEIIRCRDLLKKNKNIVNFTYWPINTGRRSSDIDGYKIRKPNVKYKIAAIAALWNKKQFIKYVKDNDENIWQFEVNGTIRSNTIYKEDIFYCTEESNLVIPYDFTRLGLISGKWFEETVNFFEAEKIKINYKKRGIFEPALHGKNNAFISSFKIEAYCIPLINKMDYNTPVFHKKTFPIGKFKLSFDITNAKKMLKLTLCDQTGYGIKNLNIEIIYLDDTKEIISIDKLFGNFLKEDDLLVFNMQPADIFIPFKNKKAKKLNVTGESVCPLSDELLRKSYLYKIEPETKKLKDTSFLLDLDSYLFNLGTAEDLVIEPKLNNKKYINKKIVKDKHHYEFEINDKTEHIEELVLSRDTHFSINKIRFYNDKHKKVKILEGFEAKVRQYYVFTISHKLKVQIPKDSNKVILEFNLQQPVKKIVLVKGYSFYDKIWNWLAWKRSWIICKSKTIIKKLSGKKMEN